MIDPLIIRTLFGALGIGVVGGTAIVGSIVFNRNGKRIEASTTKEEEPTPVKAPKKKTFSVSELWPKYGNTKLLVREGKDGKDPDWKVAGDNYRKHHDSITKNGEDPLKIEDFVSKKDDEDAPEDFLDKCDSESKKQVLSRADEAYFNVFVGCTKGNDVLGSK